jgi:hypothetical protein
MHGITSQKTQIFVTLLREPHILYSIDHFGNFEIVFLFKFVFSQDFCLFMFVTGLVELLFSYVLMRDAVCGI